MSFRPIVLSLPLDEYIVIFRIANGLCVVCLFFLSLTCLYLFIFFFFTGVQVHELFSKSGDVKRIIIGLDKVKKTACGFCFVEYPLVHFLSIDPGNLVHLES